LVTTPSETSRLGDLRVVDRHVTLGAVDPHRVGRVIRVILVVEDL
jgi:hypothetical protein